MCIGAEPDVVSQVPSGVVWILVDHDLVGIPQPAVAEGDVGCRHIPVPSIEPEAAGAAAAKMPNMLTSKSAGKAAVRPGMIHVIARVVGAGIVTYPLFSIHMRHVRVAC